jgi:phosphatidylglycerol lysyltransferase
VAGEPLGSEKDLPQITRRFLDHARSKKRVVAFLPSTEKFARTVSSSNVRIVKVGATPYFDLAKWDPRGNSAKKLRLGINHGRRANIVVSEVRELTAGFRREAAELMRSWANGRRAGVSFGWLFELVPFQKTGDRKYFAARNAKNELVGLLAASPIPARDGWYLEDVLRSVNAPAGTSDLLVFEALKGLAAQGAKLATLGTVPLSAKGENDISSKNNFLINKSLKFSKRYLNSMYNFDGLETFKSKFVPTWWESEYVVVSKGRLISPRVANAIFNIVVPGGLLQILQILADQWI